MQVTQLLSASGEGGLFLGLMESVYELFEFMELDHVLETVLREALQIFKWNT